MRVIPGRAPLPSSICSSARACDDPLRPRSPDPSMLTLPDALEDLRGAAGAAPPPSPTPAIGVLTQLHMAMPEMDTRAPKVNMSMHKYH